MELVRAVVHGMYEGKKRRTSMLAQEFGVNNDEVIAGRGFLDDLLQQHWRHRCQHPPRPHMVRQRRKRIRAHAFVAKACNRMQREQTITATSALQASD